MGIDKFQSEDEISEARVERPDINKSNKDKARPYVSREVHEKVNLFSSNLGLGMQATYDLLLNKAVTNTYILENILTSDNEYHDTLTDSEEELLLELIGKANDLGRFPTRQEINKDDNLSGFPVYITYLGKRERIMSMMTDDFSENVCFELEA